MIQDARGWRSGMTQRDGMGREMAPWWIHVNVWQNQYNIVK